MVEKEETPKMDGSATTLPQWKCYGSVTSIKIVDMAEREKS